MVLIKVLREFVAIVIMGKAHQLTKVVNSKVAYVISTTHQINSKLTQVIRSMKVMADTFDGWKTRFNAYVKNRFCHFNLNQIFISLYSLELNNAHGALLHLTEIDDLVQQLAHLS